MLHCQISCAIKNVSVIDIFNKYFNCIYGMSRSFGIVESKLHESEFFLNHILEEPLQTRYYVSAFLTATRSVTFALQASLKNVSGFNEWYSVHQDRLRKHDLAKFCVEARNKVQKEADYCMMDSGIFDGEKLIFTGVFIDDNKIIGDVKEVCMDYFLLILNLIYDCYQNFGSIIDPDQYYTLDNFAKLGMVIEDAEEMLGFPRGWTEGIPDEERMRLLRDTAAPETASYLFEEYLKRDKYGNKIEN